MAIVLNQCLPSKLRIKSIDNGLYRIGLLNKNNDPEQLKRRIIHHPVLVFILMLLFWLRLNVFIITSNNDIKVSKHYGDYGQMYGVGLHFNLAAFLILILSISIQLIYYYNHKSGVEPTFLRVFQMMSGLRSPKSIGLTNETQILALMRKTRIAYKVVVFTAKYGIPVDGILIFGFGYFIHDFSCDDIVIYGVSNTLFGTIACYHALNIHIYNIFYFYILCCYLKIKIKSIDESISRNKSMRIADIDSYLKSMNSLYSEISEYNVSLFSKFLLVYWLTIGSAIVLIVYMVFISSSLDELMLLMFTYSLIVFSTAFLFVIFTASSVNYKSNDSRKILIHLMVSYFLTSNGRKYPGRINAQIKLSLMIERLAVRRVGFSCWKLFTINYFRCYEIISLLCCLFLKIVEMSYSDK